MIRELGRSSWIIRDILVQPHEHAPDEDAHKLDLDTCCHREVKLPFVRSARKKRDEERNRNDEGREQAKELEVNV
eukprot:4451857-Prymnesium_polylepis.1